MTCRQVIDILQAHGDEIRNLGVKQLSLFGSVTRDSLGPRSDVDILVKFSKTTYRRFLGLKTLLERALGRKVDLVTPPAVNGRFKKEIIKDIVNVPT